MERQNLQLFDRRAGQGRDSRMEIHFTKLHENGIDFIVIDEFEKTVIPDDMKAQFAAIYCDRKFGIGADSVIFLLKSTTSDIRMRIFRPDESEASLYGNGVRCLARYAFDAGYVKESCTVETPAGTMGVTMGYKEEDFLATLTMQTPRYERRDIPATGSGEYQEKIAGFDVYAVNTGVPHAVIVVDSVDAIDLETIAPQVRHHATFPDGVNVNFVERNGNDTIRIRTFDRDTEEEIISSGSGATASAALLHKLGLAGDVVDVETRGGTLTIYLREGVKMEGPSTTVFTGVISF